MPRGLHTKREIRLENSPDSVWWYRCPKANNEIIFTSRSKQAYDRWRRLHCKKCDQCIYRLFWTSEQGRSNPSGHMNITKIRE